jgi:hypothetical protein
VSSFRFRAWDKLDPLGTFLGELSENVAGQPRGAFDRTVSIAFVGPGAGVFKINVNDPQFAYCETGTYVKVHLEASATAVGAFFLEEGSETLVSEEEEGGEIRTRGGRGPLIYLERAIVDHVQRTANAFTIDADAAELVWVDKKVGRILKDLIEEAQARTPDPIAALTYTWSATLDSAGNPWDTVDEDFRIPIGLDLLGAIETLKGQGLHVMMTPELELKAWQDYVAPSSGVTFTKGVNVREAAEKEVHASTAKSRILVQGTRKSGAIIYKTVTDAGVEADIGPHEGFMQYQRSATLARLEKAGNRQLAALKRSSDGLTTIGVTVGDGTAGARGTGAGHYVPFTDYFPGETFGLELPPDFVGATKIVDAITLKETEAGEYDPILSFNIVDFNSSVGESAPGGGKPFAGDDQTGGGTTPAPTEPVPMETLNCVGMSPRSWLRRFSPWGGPVEEGVLGGLIILNVGSTVAFNSAWSVSACPIGGGSWTGWEDRESWWQFTAPADASDYLGLMVTIDALGAYTTGQVGGYSVGIYPGAIAAGLFGKATLGIAGTIVGSEVTVYIPRSLVNWGGVNSIVLHPEWECARSFFTCNGAAYFGSPLGDGRGGSGGYYGIEVDQACPVRFVPGQTGLSTPVSPYGAVDGVNRTFTLIGWDGTGVPEVTINGIEESTTDVVFNRTTRTMTLESAPPERSVLLADYSVGPITGTITLTPDPVPLVLVVPELALPAPVFLLIDPVPIGLAVPDVTIS